MNHSRIAAGLHLASSLFIAAAVIGLWVLAADIAEGLSGTSIPALLAFFGKPIAVAALVVAGVELLSAMALLAGTRMRWPRYALAAIGLMQLWAFPIGTAIGLYTFWALFRSTETTATAPPGPPPR